MLDIGLQDIQYRKTGDWLRVAERKLSLLINEKFLQKLVVQQVKSIGEASSSHSKLAVLIPNVLGWNWQVGELGTLN